MNNTILKDNRPTKEVKLPSYPDSIVVIYPSLLVGSMIGLKKNTDEVQLGIESTIKLIKSWNFTDEKGKPLDVNIENLGLLPVEDLEYLMKEITEFAIQVKKN